MMYLEIFVDVMKLPESQNTIYYDFEGTTKAECVEGC